MEKNQGFTLTELIIAVAILAIISTITFVAMDPAGRLAGARNTQRKLHLEAVMNSVKQNIADASGAKFSCTNGDIPTTTAKTMAIGAGNYDIASCIVPFYVSTLPFDPSDSLAHYTSVTDYNTGYTIIQNFTTKVITLSAPSAELGNPILVAR